ncbi:hypothetical protein [Geobacter sp. DSM 9736]|uniref:hypothetical protein n=1 Tax=Geobacter sp. DSM 9736 TaxID=1277350 RepID=UPI000B5045DF|nr:hypothetical protein [Geobacter sp. DSM 9736]SNB45890.1 hypothetical protein SAMN06269301_1321 [Geobacter sp. DSM 9736]
MRKMIVFALAAVLTACSLPPERPVLKEELYKTRIYQLFIIKESPESVVAALNREGEVVLEVQDKKENHYYLRLMATSGGLQMKVVPR